MPPANSLFICSTVNLSASPNGASGPVWGETNPIFNAFASANARPTGKPSTAAPAKLPPAWIRVRRRKRMLPMGPSCAAAGLNDFCCCGLGQKATGMYHARDSARRACFEDLDQDRARPRNLVVVDLVRRRRIDRRVDARAQPAENRR